MKLLDKLFKKKQKAKEQDLLNEYNKGKILQVDNQVNNQEYFQKIENDKCKESNKETN